MTFASQLKIERNCEFCGTTYQIYPSAAKNGKGKFCSRSCWAGYRSGANAANWQGGPIKFICPVCSEEFYVSRSRAKNKNVICCSRICGKKFYCGKNSPSWRGGNCNNGDGYIRTTLSGHKKKYKLTHRLAVEKIIGRTLRRGEIVHHINGIKDDNRNCNLLVCENSYHHWLHRKMAKLYQHEHFGNI